MKGNKIMDKNAQITKMLASLIASGMDVKQAINTVFGAGAYEKMAGNIYDALREKAGK